MTAQVVRLMTDMWRPNKRRASDPVIVIPFPRIHPSYTAPQPTRDEIWRAERKKKYKATAKRKAALARAKKLKRKPTKAEYVMRARNYQKEGE